MERMKITDFGAAIKDVLKIITLSQLYAFIKFIE
jgi:hypothetical protein